METSHWNSGYSAATPNAYFITLCTQNQIPILADYANGSMELNACGEIVNTIWTQLRSAFPNIELDAHVVMPNHFHGLIWVGANTAARPQLEISTTHLALADVQVTLPRSAPPMAHVRDVLHQFKISTAAWINRYRDTPDEPVWQHRYWAQLIGVEREVSAARKLISENSCSWLQDKFYVPTIPQNDSTQTLQ